MRRNQRYIMYLCVCLLIPIYVLHQGQHHILDDELELQDQDFLDIIDRSIEDGWRENYSDQYILNKLLEYSDIEDILYIIYAIFLQIVIYRLLYLLADCSKRVKLNLVVLKKIWVFLALHYLTFLAFIILAWALCMHLLFGGEMEAYSTVILSILSTLMLAFREFTFLDDMYERSAVVTLFLYVFFIVCVMLFFAYIFVALVLFAFNEVRSQQDRSIRRRKLEEAQNPSEKNQHWVHSCMDKLQALNCFESCCKGRSVSRLCQCCMRKKSRDLQEIIE